MTSNALSSSTKPLLLPKTAIRLVRHNLPFVNPCRILPDTFLSFLRSEVVLLHVLCDQVPTPIQQQAHIFCVVHSAADVPIEAFRVALHIPCRIQLQQGPGFRSLHTRTACLCSSQATVPCFHLLYASLSCLSFVRAPCSSTKASCYHHLSSCSSGWTVFELGGGKKKFFLLFTSPKVQSPAPGEVYPCAPVHAGGRPFGEQRLKPPVRLQAGMGEAGIVSQLGTGPGTELRCRVLPLQHLCDHGWFNGEEQIPPPAPHLPPSATLPCASHPSPTAAAGAGTGTGKCPPLGEVPWAPMAGGPLAGTQDRKEGLPGLECPQTLTQAHASPCTPLPTSTPGVG